MTEHTDELRALRERAYGPTADIDPESLRRLHELEDLGRRETATASPTDATPWAVVEAPEDELDEPAASAALDAGETSAAEGLAGAPIADPVDTDAALPRRRWWTRRMPLLWVGSVVAAAVLGAVSATGIQSLVTGQVAVLELDETSPWPESFGGSRPEGGRLFDALGGLDVLAVPQQFGDDSSGPECLYVTADSGPSRGVSTAGCAAGSFAATASMVVTTDSPDALRGRFPEGTSLQFRLEDSRVLVYAARG